MIEFWPLNKIRTDDECRQRSNKSFYDLQDLIDGIMKNTFGEVDLLSTIDTDSESEVVMLDEMALENERNAANSDESDENDEAAQGANEPTKECQQRRKSSVLKLLYNNLSFGSLKRKSTEDEDEEDGQKRNSNQSEKSVFQYFQPSGFLDGQNRMKLIKTYRSNGASQAPKG